MNVRLKVGEDGRDYVVLVVEEKEEEESEELHLWCSYFWKYY